MFKRLKKKGETTYSGSATGIPNGAMVTPIEDMFTTFETEVETVRKLKKRQFKKKYLLLLFSFA